MTSCPRPPRRLTLTAICVTSLLGSCGFVDYEAMPLDPMRVVAETAHARAELEAPTDPVTLRQAGEWLREHGPGIRTKIAAYETAKARADAGNPLPNPTIQVGVQIPSGAGLDSGDTEPFGGIGFSIPTGGRLSRADELDRARAELARIDAIATLRESWFALRADYVRLAIARERLFARRDLGDVLTRSVEVVRRLVEAGSASATDVATFELELARTEAAAIEAERMVDTAMAALATRTGTPIRAWSGIAADELPALPEALPDLAELHTRLALRNPGLLRLSAEYQAAERSLRLEIARQYPDFQFGPSMSNEPGEDFSLLGISIGIAIPIFDRNQRAIAAATGRRREVWGRFEASVQDVLSELERRHRAVELETARDTIHSDRIVPLAERNLDIVQRAAAAGTTDLLRYLEAVRSERQSRIDALDARDDLLRAWLAIESATGTELLDFPDESDEPRLPRTLQPGGPR